MFRYSWQERNTKKEQPKNGSKDNPKGNTKKEKNINHTR